MDNRILSARWILAGKAPQDAPITVKGWVRTRRQTQRHFDRENLGR
jgi:hypothetical protein